MSDKSVILGAQAELVSLQAENAEEVLEHLIKVQSILDLVVNSLEDKNEDNKLDIASELNSLVAAYDQLVCAQDDVKTVAAALNELVAEDNKNA